MNGRGKPVLAVGLLAVLAWTLYAQLSGVSLFPGAGGIPDPPAEPDLGRLQELGDVVSLTPVPLLGGTPSYELGGRNLFKYGPAKPPPPSEEELERRRKAEEERLRALEEAARKRAAEEIERKKKALEAQQALDDLEKQRKKPPPPPPPPSEPARKPPPPIGLKLVGYLGPQSGRIAVFYASKGKEIVLGKRGQVIEGKFKVLDIGAESVKMGYVDPEYADSSKIIQLGK